jgi:hypothetical protein
MDRKEFLRGCATGLCACAAACLPNGAAAADDTAKPEDWRLPFVKKRYAKLLGTLSERMDEKTLSATLQEVGSFCAAQDNKITNFRGDLDGYCKELAKYGTTVARDEVRKVYIVSGTPQADCFCPLNSVMAKTPGVACECTLGWNRYNWNIVLQKETKVVLLESVLRGGKVCKVEISAA